MNSEVFPQVQRLLTQAKRLGEAFELLIPEDDRGQFGIFYTQPIEVEFMCRQVLAEYLIENTQIDTSRILSFVYFDQTSAPSSLSSLSIQERDQIRSCVGEVKICDPACGSGVFLVGMLNILCELTKRLLSESDGLISDFVLRKHIIQKNLFGMDIQPWAISIAELNLWFVTLQNPGFQMGTLDSSLFLPSLKHNLHVGDSLLNKDQKFALNSFDIIISNPPYVRQEDILPSNQLPRRSLKRSRREYIEAIHANIQEVWGEEFVQELRYDLYVYFFFQGISMLKPGGVLAFLTSNAWLDVQYGIPLQQFLLRNSLIKEIYENRSNRSFSQAAINTIITILQRSVRSQAQDNIVKFVAMKESLQNTLNFNFIQAIKQAKSAITTREYRCFPLRQIDLWKLGNRSADHSANPQLQKFTDFQGHYTGFKWGGTFLRAPNVYLKLIGNPPPALKRIGDFGSIHRGITTGANEFFYVKAINCKGPVWTVKNGHGQIFDIERTYLHPLIKGPEKINYLNLNLLDSDYYVLLLPPDLPSQSHAYSYVQWGEKVPVKIKKGLQRGQITSGYHSLESFRNKHPWYTLTTRDLTHFAISKAIWARHFVAFSQTGVMLDQRIYGLYNVPEIIDLELLGATLNSSLTQLAFELNGRTNLGQGVLDLATSDVKTSWVVDPMSLPRKDANALRRTFRAMQNRSIETLDWEMNCPHRMALDVILLGHLGLSSKEIKDLRQNLLLSVTQRRVRAGSPC